MCPASSPETPGVARQRVAQRLSKHSAILLASMRLTSVKAIYSHLAKTYDRDLRDDMKYTAHVQIPRLIVDALGSRQANVLDLGCGTDDQRLQRVRLGHPLAETTGRRIVRWRCVS